MTVKVNYISKDESPELVLAIWEVVEQCVEHSIETILDETGAHPVTGITAMVNRLAHLLRRMDRKAANVILKDIAHEHTNVAAQAAASQTLLLAYEAQCDMMDHEERGGLLS